MTTNPFRAALESLDRQVGHARTVEASDPLDPVRDARRIRDLRAALKHLQADDYNLWIDVGHALATGGAEGRALWLEWSATSDRFDANEAGAKWATFKPTGTNWKSVFVKARAAGWDGSGAGTPETPGEDEAQEEYAQVSLVDMHLEPDVEFVLEGRIPRDEVTLLAGHGGAGKSFWALMLAVCTALGMDFLGMRTRAGKVLFFSAEDRSRTVRRRLHAICTALKVDPRDLQGKLVILDATRRSRCVLFSMEDHRTGASTGNMARLGLRIERERPDLVVIDNLSNVFAANENDKVPVTAFVSELVDIAESNALALLLLGHVDKGTSRGDRTGTESYSGNTAWHNAVRSRLYLQVKGGVVQLVHQKSTHDREQRAVEFTRGEGGVLALVKFDPEAHVREEVIQRRALLRFIGECTERSEYVSVEPTSRTSVSAMARRYGVAQRLKLAPGEVSMLALQCEQGGLLRRVGYTKDHKPRTRWELTQAGKSLGESAG